MKAQRVPHNSSSDNKASAGVAASQVSDKVPALPAASDWSLDAFEPESAESFQARERSTPIESAGDLDLFLTEETLTRDRGDAAAPTDSAVAQTTVAAPRRHVMPFVIIGLVAGIALSLLPWRLPERAAAPSQEMRAPLAPVAAPPPPNVDALESTSIVDDHTLRSALPTAVAPVVPNETSVDGLADRTSRPTENPRDTIVRERTEDRTSSRPAADATSVSPSLAAMPPTATPSLLSVPAEPVTATRPMSPSDVAVSPALGPPLPAVVAPAPVAARDTAEIETAAIERVLTHYTSAFSDLDAAAVSEVWPTVDFRALARAFRGLEQQAIDFSSCDISLTGDDAGASCDGTMRFVAKIGSRSPRAEVRRWQFSLRKTDERWLIQTVDIR